MIYAGGTMAIAALEKYVHMEGVVPADLVLVRIDLPENCSEKTLPPTHCRLDGT